MAAYWIRGRDDLLPIWAHLCQSAYGRRRRTPDIRLMASPGRKLPICFGVNDGEKQTVELLDRK